MLKIKKILLILSLSMVMNLISVLPLQSVYAVSDIVSYKDMDFTIRSGTTDQLILTSYNGSGSDIAIPETIDGNTVTAIDDTVFEGNTAINSVTLPDSINYFGEAVFSDSSVRSVNIPKGVKMIPSYTFYNCQELTDVDFHDDIVVIADTAFKKTGVTVPDKLRSRVTRAILKNSDAYCAFSTDEWDYSVSCSKGTVYLEFLKYRGQNSDIVFPDDLCYYDELTCANHVFNSTTNVKSVVFPEKMSDFTVSFTGSAIEKVVLPQMIDMGASMFANCTKLKTVVFRGENGSITIGDRAFKNCTSLTDITFPENCAKITIGNNAFENTGIGELSLNYPSEIGNSAFSECGSLKTVKLNNASVANRAFMDCASLSDMTFVGETVLDDLSVYCCNSLENVSFSDCKLTSYNAFRECPNLYTIDGKNVFSQTKGDFIPEYKDFIFSHFNGSDNVGFVNEYVTACVDRIVNEYTDESMNDTEKVLALHDWVCDNTKYTEGNINDRENHNDASVFMNEYTVCEGYARACNLLYHAAGIESYYVHSSDHAWNIVKIDGHYFHVDATWDDLDGTSRKWFMKSDDEFRKEGGSHAEWVLSAPSPLHEFQGDVLPECKYRMGDANADGSINVADLVSLQGFLLGRSDLEKEHWVLSDVCHDGKINVFDMVILRQSVINELA